MPSKPVIPPKKSLPPPVEPMPSGGLVAFLAHFERYAWDLAGILLISLALLTLAALLVPSLTAGLLASWGTILRRWLGFGAVWFVLFTGWLGVWMMRRSGGVAFWSRFLTLELAAIASLAFFSIVGGMSLEEAEAGHDGGQLGWGFAALLYRLLHPVGLGGLVPLGILTALLVLFFVFAGLGGGALVRRLLSSRRAALPGLGSTAASGIDNGASIVEVPLGANPSPGLPPAARKRSPIIPPQFRKNFRLEPDEPAAPAAIGPRDERLPPLDLLVFEHYNRPDERTINQTAGLIEKTLAEFGIPAKVTDFRIGPTVTQFAVQPGYLEKDKDKDKAYGESEAARQKVRVAQISALSRDLTLALAAERLRIEAPVPGRPYVGIEVPNPRLSVVRLRPIMEQHEAFAKTGRPLAVALGRDVSGAPVVADLGKMPHLLIAGTTGSGKSVCIAAITMSLVMNNLPEDLRLVMIDPKMVELVRFNGLPHLYGKVETDAERIQGVLRWVVAEMDRRYKLLEVAHARNIDTYNRKVSRRTVQRADLPVLERIVVMIDELADMMMSSPDETEHNLVRLAQMARAVGIHLVVATQRPSVDVVTGLIKANFPARISFAVASSIDSRVILDTTGAETLLGRGDMLFLPPDASGPQRLQGVMVSDAEVEKVILYWQKARPHPETVEPSPWDAMMAEEAVLADRDGLIEKAIELVRNEQRASASMLQRRLRVGYPRAARLITELEELGVIGPSAGGGRDREVLIGPDDSTDTYEAADE